MDTENRMLNILVLDDSPAIRNLLRSILKTRTNVFAVESPSLAFKILDNENIDILICDYRLPEMNGLKVLEQVKTRKQSIEVIMISDSGDMDTVIQALRNGAADFLKKPFSANELWVAIERTQKISDLNSTIHQVKRNNQRLKNEVNEELFHPIIGNSEQIKSILQQIQMVAQTPDTSVLIIGESGTGKELVARGIHQKSKRKDELFGAVNMSAVPESLFESEFFGHKKGSFTGAFADKAGWFETINNGTLFLDEIGEMSMQLQVKLLRVLEDRIFIKVGHQKEQKFDIRIVSATNKTLDELTGTKVFRTDLFHRLGTFIIHIPPLRERKDDIPILAEYLLKQITKKMYST